MPVQLNPPFVVTRVSEDPEDPESLGCCSYRIVFTPDAQFKMMVFDLLKGPFSGTYQIKLGFDGGFFGPAITSGEESVLQMKADANLNLGDTAHCEVFLGGVAGLYVPQRNTVTARRNGLTMDQSLRWMTYFNDPQVSDQNLPPMFEQTMRFFVGIVPSAFGGPGEASLTTPAINMGLATFNPLLIGQQNRFRTNGPRFEDILEGVGIGGTAIAPEPPGRRAGR